MDWTVAIIQVLFLSHISSLGLDCSYNTGVFLVTYIFFRAATGQEMAVV